MSFDFHYLEISVEYYKFVSLFAVEETVPGNGIIQKFKVMEVEKSQYHNKTQLGTFCEKEKRGPLLSPYHKIIIYQPIVHTNKMVIRIHLHLSTI